MAPYSMSADRCGHTCHLHDLRSSTQTCLAWFAYTQGYKNKYGRGGLEKNSVVKINRPRAVYGLAYERRRRFTSFTSARKIALSSCEDQIDKSIRPSLWVDALPKRTNLLEVSRTHVANFWRARHQFATAPKTFGARPCARAKVFLGTASAKESSSSGHRSSAALHCQRPSRRPKRLV